LPDYRIGTANPPLTPDPGAGPWKSKTATLTYIALKSAILEALPYAWLVYDDAAKHLYHYFQNTGSNYTIDFQGMISEVPKARRAVDQEIAKAQAFAETLPPGAHQLTSGSTFGFYIHKSDSANWFFANGGVQIWGKGRVNVTQTATTLNYAMTLEIWLWDRYNWDGKKSTTIGPITVTDAEMAEFHRMGLAREFDCYGKVTESRSWSKTLPAPPPQLHPRPHPTHPAPSPGPKPPAPQPGVYIVKPGDSLSKIAMHYYHDSSKWKAIYAANRSIIGANPNLIFPGQKLVIP
jgi:nucleoid-associated protein YgaU